MTSPYAIGYWNGNQFVIPGLPTFLPPPQQATPAVTQQDVEAHQAASALSSPSPFGGPGGQAGGMERDAGFADPMRQGGAAPAPGQDTKDMGGPRSWGSTLGTLGSLAGFAVPGPAGMALGLAGNLGGSWIDARAANRGLMEQGLPPNVSTIPAAASNGLFGLLGALGVGRSISDQVGDIKNQALAREQGQPLNLGFFPGVVNLDPVQKENLGFLPGMTMGDFSKEGVAAGGEGNGTSSADGTKADPGKDSDVWGGGTGGTSYGYATGGVISRAGRNARPSQFSRTLPDYMTDADMNRAAGSQGNWSPPVPPGVQRLMDMIEMGAARNAPVTGPLDPAPDRPSYAKGGEITPQQMSALNAIDPPGPDDQIAAVQTGEGVLTRKAMKRFPGLLDALNRGDVKKARGILG